MTRNIVVPEERLANRFVSAFLAVVNDVVLEMLLSLPVSFDGTA